MLSYIANNNTLSENAHFEYMTGAQTRAVIIINETISAISLVASVLVYTIYWFFKENRNFNYELVLWFCFSDAMYSLTAFFPFNPKLRDGWCASQSFFLTTFQYSSLCWSAIIGYTAFMGVIRKNHIEKNKKKYRLLFISLSFLIPGFLASM
jgi:hypothetical protein